MNRRHFLSQIGSTVVLLSLSNTFTSCEKGNKICFGICSDVHHGLIPDAPERLQCFIDAAKNNTCDFIIQLGDFCSPNTDSKLIVDIWNQYPKAKYHALGNHDMDVCNKQEFMQFIGMEQAKPYYSFTQNGFKFIILDPNYIRTSNGEFVDYDRGNYYGADLDQIPPEQLRWFKNELETTEQPVIIMSHQMLHHDVANKDEVMALIKQHASKIMVVFSGHQHSNWHEEIDGVHHIQINSMSYEWLGEEYACDTRYTKEEYEKRPILKSIAPYKDSLFAFVELHSSGKIIIEGINSEYIGPTPEELGHTNNVFPHSPSISSYNL